MIPSEVRMLASEAAAMVAAWQAGQLLARERDARLHGLLGNVAAYALRGVIGRRTPPPYVYDSVLHLYRQGALSKHKPPGTKRYTK